MLLDDLEIVFGKEIYLVRFEAEITDEWYTPAVITADPYNSEPADGGLEYEIHSIECLAEDSEEWENGDHLADHIKAQCDDYIRDMLER